MQKLFQKLRDALQPTSKSPSSLGAADLQLAAALLLVEVGKADFDWQDSEISTVKSRLQQQFNLSDADANELFNQALENSEQHVSLHPVVDLLNDHSNPAEKIQIIEDCWRVAYADGVLDKYEEHHIRQLAEWLYVSHEDFIKTKLKVQPD